MDAFDESAMKVDRLMSSEEKYTEGMELALSACMQKKESGIEPANLRDARSDLLLRCLHFAVLHKENLEDFEDRVRGLLDRRIFNWHNGVDFEAMNFVGVFPKGVGVFDAGFDREKPLAMHAYAVAMVDRSFDFRVMAYLAWFQGQFESVLQQMQFRMSAIEADYRIGARVLVVGLKKATVLNGRKGTITRSQGQRWAIIMDNMKGVAIRAANLIPLRAALWGKLAGRSVRISLCSVRIHYLVPLFTRYY